MSYEIFKLSKIQYLRESAGNYAVNLSGTMPYKAIKVLEDDASVELLLEMLDNKTMQQRVDGMEPKIPSRKRCNLSFTSYLNGQGTFTQSLGVDPIVSTPNGELLNVIMGGFIYGVPTMETVASMPDSSTIILAAPLGIYPGLIIGFPNPTNNWAPETAYIVSITGSDPNAMTCSLSRQLDFSLPSGSLVTVAATNYLTQDPDTSLQFYVQGANSEDTWVVAGLNGGFSLKTEIGQLPQISYKFENGATWFDCIADDLYPETYTDANPVSWVDGHVWLTLRNNDSAQIISSQTLDIDTIEFTPAIAYGDVTSQRGVNNIIRKRRNRVVPVMTGKFVTYFGGKEFWDYREDQNDLCIQMQVGNEFGNVVSIVCPRIRVTNAARVETSTGLIGVEVTFDVLEPINDTTGDFSTDLYIADILRSAFKIGFV